MSFAGIFWDLKELNVFLTYGRSSWLRLSNESYDERVYQRQPRGIDIDRSMFQMIHIRGLKIKWPLT